MKTKTNFVSCQVSLEYETDGIWQHVNKNHFDDQNDELIMTY